MNIETITSAILREMSVINKWRRDFFHHHISLFLSLRGRYKYLNFERYGQKHEPTHRNHHKSGFDFRIFNRCLIEKHTGSRRLIIFAPSYIPNSGNYTPSVDSFWSGRTGKVKWGLELYGFAAVDIVANTTLHYFAAQTLLEDGQRLMDFYCGLPRQQAMELLKMSRYLVVYAFLFKKPVVNTAIESSLHFITRLRDDAVLHYAPPPKKESQKGRPQKYGERFSARNLDAGQLPCIAQTEVQRIYGGVEYVKSLKRMVKIALVHELKKDRTIKSAKIFICKNPEFPAQDIWPWCKSRFQIEFLYGNAKQHTGLQGTQSRHSKALKYHFNMSLTTDSVAEVYFLFMSKSLRGAFSMAHIKTQYFNELMVDRGFEMFANIPNITINYPTLSNLYNRGKIAA